MGKFGLEWGSLDWNGEVWIGMGKFGLEWGGLDWNRISGIIPDLFSGGRCIKLDGSELSIHEVKAFMNWSPTVKIDKVSYPLL